MSSILNELAKLATDLDLINALKYADQVDDISAIMSNTDVASGQHTPAGDAMWTAPTVGVNLNKDAMGLNDIPIGDAPYANRGGIPSDDMEMQFFSGKEEGPNMPPINDKYEMDLRMDDELDKLEASFFNMGLKRRAFEIYSLRKNNIRKQALELPWPLNLMPSELLGQMAREGFTDAIVYVAKKDPTGYNLMLNQARKSADFLKNNYNFTDEILIELLKNDLTPNQAINKATPVGNPRPRDNKLEEAQRYVAVYYSRMKAIASYAKQSPSASGPINQKTYSGLKPLQVALGVDENGVWDRQTIDAWQKFIDERAVPFLNKSKRKLLTPDYINSLKTKWASVAMSLGYTADWSGMLKFYKDVVSAPSAPAPSAPASVPAALNTETPEEVAETRPVDASEVKKALNMLMTEKSPHMAEGDSVTAKSLGGGTAKRRAERYIRHLDKAIHGEDSPLDKISNAIVKDYQNELQIALAGAEKNHGNAYTDEHRTAHLTYIVYTLLQRMWGKLTGREGRAGRREDRQINRGERRVERKERRAEK